MSSCSLSASQVVADATTDSIYHRTVSVSGELSYSKVSLPTHFTVAASDELVLCPDLPSHVQVGDFVVPVSVVVLEYLPRIPCLQCNALGMINKGLGGRVNYRILQVQCRDCGKYSNANALLATAVAIHNNGGTLPSGQDGTNIRSCDAALHVLKAANASIDPLAPLAAVETAMSSAQASRAAESFASVAARAALTVRKGVAGVVKVVPVVSSSVPAATPIVPSPSSSDSSSGHSAMSMAQRKADEATSRFEAALADPSANLGDFVIGELRSKVGLLQNPLDPVTLMARAAGMCAVTVNGLTAVRIAAIRNSMLLKTGVPTSMIGTILQGEVGTTVICPVKAVDYVGSSLRHIGGSPFAFDPVRNCRPSDAAATATLAKRDMERTLRTWVGKFQGSLRYKNDPIFTEECRLMAKALARASIPDSGPAFDSEWAAAALFSGPTIDVLKRPREKGITPHFGLRRNLFSVLETAESRMADSSDDDDEPVLDGRPLQNSRESIIARARGKRVVDRHHRKLDAEDIFNGLVAAIPVPAIPTSPAVAPSTSYVQIPSGPRPGSPSQQPGGRVITTRSGTTYTLQTSETSKSFPPELEAWMEAQVSGATGHDPVTSTGSFDNSEAEVSLGDPAGATSGDGNAIVSGIPKGDAGMC